jgi:hypothetical protein
VHNFFKAGVGNENRRGKESENLSGIFKVFFQNQERTNYIKIKAG